jgi:GlpG protein
MRQVGNSEDTATANRFADFLLTQGIDAKVTRAKAGWDVWVIEEDQVAKARELWVRFIAEPGNPAYAQASLSARKLRQLEEREEKAYERRQETFERRVEGTGAIRAPLTVLLIVVSVVVYLLGMSGDKKRVQDALWFQAPSGEVQIGSPQELVRFPFSLRAPLESIAKGQVWRLVSPIFLHLDGIHLLFNMLMLSSLGTALERSIGTWRLALMVLVLAVFSNCAQAFFGPGIRFGGMSGVLYGIAGFIWVASVRAPRMGLFMSPGTAMLLVGWLLMGILAPVPSSPMANWAHGAGLAGGLAIGWVWTTLGRE